MTMYMINPPTEHEPDLTNAELLGVIANLQNIIRAYEKMAGSYDHKAAMLRNERDRARALAATLEAECNNCWGPVHTQVIAAARSEYLMSVIPNEG